MFAGSIVKSSQRRAGFNSPAFVRARLQASLYNNRKARRARTTVAPTTVISPALITMSATVNGNKTTFGTINATLHMTSSAEGNETAFGVATGSIALTSTVNGNKTTFGTVAGAISLTSAASGSLPSGPSGIAGLAGVGEYVLNERWVHLSDCVASDSVETIADLGADTNYDFWNGNDSGTSDNCTISGFGTDTGYIEATDAGDFLVSKQTAAIATDWNRLVRSDQDATWIFAFRTPSSIGTAFYFNIDSSSSGDPDFRILSVSGNLEVRVADGTGAFKNTNMGSISVDTDYVLAIKQSGTALSYALNARTFTSGTDIGTNTDNCTSNIGILATDAGTTGATGGRYYGDTLLSIAISDTELSDIVDYVNTNTPVSVA